MRGGGKGVTEGDDDTTDQYRVLHRRRYYYTIKWMFLVTVTVRISPESSVNTNEERR